MTPPPASGPTGATPPAARLAYTRACRAAAAEVLARYSTSFSLSVRALPQPVRVHITAIYAMARVADEIVDGAFAHASPADRSAELSAFAARVAAATEHGCSSDVIAHAFGATAREVGIGPAEWGPFFASMRSDIAPQPHTPESVAAYIHGSAEVIGLMCLQAFFDGAVPEASAGRLRRGAMALGAAFQKVNFLRDLAWDTDILDRAYFPGVTAGTFDDAARDRLTAEIDSDLRTAAATFELLPGRVRPAVQIAHDLFAELNRQLATTSAAEICTRRIRVTDPRKALIAARVAAAAGVHALRRRQP